MDKFERSFGKKINNNTRMTSTNSSYNNTNTNTNNIFAKPKAPEFKLKNEHFPDISCNTIVDNHTNDTKDIFNKLNLLNDNNYLEKIENNNILSNKKENDIIYKNKMKEELRVKHEQHEYHIQASNIMDKLIEKWDKYNDDFIELHGQEYHEHMYPDQYIEESYIDSSGDEDYINNNDSDSDYY
jgi:hypothetical protein